MVESFLSKKLEAFPVSSRLCLFSGLMAVLSPEDWVAIQEEKYFAAELVEEIFTISKCVEESELMLLCARNLIQWTNAMRNITSLDAKETNISVTKSFKNMFSEEGTVIKQMFDYVIQYREHFIDTFRHVCKDLFKSVIKLHLSSSDMSAQQSRLLKNMAFYLLNDLPYHSSGKYGLLSCIVEVIGTNTLLQWHPSFPEELFNALEDINLVSHVSDLCHTLFNHFSGNDDEFVEVWLKPLLEILSHNCKQKISVINEYILPKLLISKPFCLPLLLSKLSQTWEENGGNSFCALITCIKFHQKMFNNKVDGVSHSSLKKALCHADEQIRLSAFALLCEDTKTSSVVQLETLELIKYGLPWNITSQSPSFRQQLISFIKKNFLIWMKEYLLDCLHPGANFPRRVTALNLLFLYHTSFSDVLPVSKCWKAAQTMIYALQDTYENNKLLAFEMLSSKLNTSVELETEKILHTAFMLASSTKPPDTVTASYLFAFLVQCSNFQIIALEYLKQSNEQEFVDIETHFSEITHSNSFIACLMLLIELKRQINLAKISLLDAAAHGPLYGVLACIRSILHYVDFSSIDNAYSCTQWHTLIRQLILTSFHIADIVEPVVCNSSPEGHLPMDTDPVNISQLQIAVRKAIGNRFQSAIVSDESSTRKDAIQLDIIKTRAVTAQMLLLCCWRAHKEVSLLFGEICERIPINIEDEQSSILNTTQVTDIGHYFTKQMSLVKHKGAFEQAYIGFSKLCKTLWRSNISELNKLPKIWINDILLVIEDKEKSMQLCPTRRSAGLPFIVQAVVTSEIEIINSSFFKETMSKFLNIAKYSEKTNPDAQVHALNILRTLFRDASLGEAVMPFVSEGLKISILGFKSHLWSVRNSSTLLFSALTTRIFGVNRSQDELGKKNRLTGKSFFSSYKDLYDFLHDELNHCVSSVRQRQDKRYALPSIEPSLYPILLILGRLYPAPGEKDHKLVSFIKFLHIFAESSIWKTRVLVSKALISLTSVENLPVTLEFLLESLHCNREGILCQNHVHGCLLQILNILKECPVLPAFQVDCIKNKLKNWIKQNFEQFIMLNNCFATKAVFLEILLHSMSLDIYVDLDVTLQLLNSILEDASRITQDPDKDHYLFHGVVFSLLSLLNYETLQIKSEAYFSFNELVLKFLSNNHKIVQSTTLEFLKLLFENGLESHLCSEEKSVDPVYLKNVEDILLNVLKRIESPAAVYKRNSLLVTEVLTLLKTEKIGSSCFSKAYEVLCLMPDAMVVEWEFIDSTYNFDMLKKMEFVLRQLEQCNREDICCSLLLFSSQIAVKIYYSLKSFEQKGSNCCMNDKEDSLKVFGKWLQIVEEYSQPESSYLQRRTVVTILKQISEAFVFNNVVIIGRTLSLWKILLNLLIDDEPEIKVLASEIVILLKCFYEPNLKHLPVAPTVALDFFLEIFLKINCSYPAECISALINWMLICNSENFDDLADERPFDKGEMNVFAEDIAVTFLISKHLSNYLQEQKSKLNEFLFSINKNNCDTLKQSPKLKTMNVGEVIYSCLIGCNEIFDGILERRTLLPYLDRFFDEELLKIRQKLSVIIVLLPYCNKEEEFKSQVELLVEKIGNFNYRTVFVKHILSELKTCLDKM
ncbi:thyroid adenoma-associated protein homolog [Uloborus diversus]|uniref:thyroid adenoma-associated protein homolog n=1 Tax=Uloborus diversus TaxID=327109 RepID=UPI0024092E46|nr:thyroid adenoma-associated protein homolog [Uloborus diversus]